MKSVRLGQHFLVNEEALQKLLERMPVPPKRVLEIGTGDGRLTKKLLEAGYDVTSYELDRTLYERAKENLVSGEGLRLILGDGFLDEEAYDFLASSLPYYASRRFLEWFSARSIPMGLVVLQKEFVDKILSKPGERKYGPYSVLASNCFAMEELFVIPPHDFAPRPKVFSSALMMRRLRTVGEPKSLTVRLKSLFSYRGRLVGSFVRDLKKRQLWNESLSVPEELLGRRVEDLAVNEAMHLTEGMI